ncbi:MULTISPECIES: hypothetical protein [Terrabacteria group]|uniref:hypothetical protein n=1 Tax=Bacillati TaxID=1783272 RepID=UPI001939CB6B|nr:MULTISPECIES: hypothetical protein [Terrabacteria group]MBW9212937.1 hypothetical protein [Trueperella sp. zg.1013]QRG86997.1 hypothetical protein JOS54_01420 [Bulleidia sp. zg-1006]
MKILWFIRNQEDYLTLARALQFNLDIDFATCSSSSPSWSKKHYSSPKNHNLLFFHSENALEDIYTKGELSYSFLKKDFALMQEAIEDFQPDCCISLGRYAAFIATSVNHIPFYFLQDGYLEKVRSPHNLFRGFNRLLKENHLEQILRYRDLRRFGVYFSFDIPEHLLEIQSNNTFSTSDKILLERGTSYEKMLTPVLDNYRFFEPDQILFYKAPLIIHQENMYLYQVCKQAGIPQLILPKKQRIPYDVGLCLEKEECNPEQLKEAVRYALTSRYFQENTRKGKTIPLDCLSSLLK